ncbi:hypothetical protein [Methylotenera mobilis]|nr:hypothetical protein [Methylotenera mobilis]
MLNQFLLSVPDYNNKIVNSDILEYSLNSLSLQEILFQISNSSSPEYAELLKEFYNVISRFQSDITTAAAIEESNQADPGNFFSFYTQGIIIPGVSHNIHVDSNNKLYELNYQNLHNYPIEASSFVKRAKLLFKNLSFHKDIHIHLAQTKNGGLNSFSKEFARALLALHNVMPHLSTGGTEADLILIRQETSKTGNSMDCTRQGSNKKGLVVDFEVTDVNKNTHEISNLNCEFHLKIDFNNAGKRVPPGQYKRVYFGLPIIQNKRYIALLRLGDHY